jgi:hypothetical protein
MNTLHWTRYARRFLAERILRLRETLEKLAYRIRDSIAATIGDAVAGILRALLDEHSPETVPRHDSRYDPWSDPRDSYWEEDIEEFDRDEERSAPPADAEATPHRSRWTAALTAAVEAIFWWLRRPPGPFPMATALGLGAVSGVIAYLGAPAVSMVVALAGSALSLVSLVDHTANEAEALAQAVKP